MVAQLENWLPQPNLSHMFSDQSGASWKRVAFLADQYMFVFRSQILHKLQFILLVVIEGSLVFYFTQLCQDIADEVVEVFCNRESFQAGSGKKDVGQ